MKWTAGDGEGPPEGAHREAAACSASPDAARWEQESDLESVLEASSVLVRWWGAKGSIRCGPAAAGKQRHACPGGGLQVGC